MKVQKSIPENIIKLLSFKSNLKLLFVFNFLIAFFIFNAVNAENDSESFKNKNNIQIDYLKSKGELEDYIIDTGDVLSIDFNFETFNDNYEVNPEGEILLPELYETYVRGLTTSELTKLLNRKFSEFMINPEITVRIGTFKPLRVLIQGEVRNPGFYRFPSYKSPFIYDSKTKANPDTNQLEKTFAQGQFEYSNQISDNFINIKRNSENITTISDVILRSGGITSSSDLSRIEIIRDIPIGKGGGKKRAFINLNSFLNESDDSNDLRIFDGDSIFIPKLSQSSENQIPRSVLSGLSPKFITVDIFGRVENPGSIKLPLEATLSDAIDLTGPIKPLSGKIVLIRYENDGTVLKKNISYYSRAKRGSRRNPFVKEGDLISVKDSLLGKSSEIIREFTAPFIGIYSTKEILESFND